MNQWKNNCKICGKEKTYTRKSGLDRSVKRGNLCGSCSKKGISKTAEHKLKISKSHFGIKHLAKTKQKIGETRRLKNIKPISGEKHPFYGKFGKYSNSWKGFGDISGRYWRRVIEGAKHRNLNLDITIEDAWNQFLNQNGKCALSGVLLQLGLNRGLSFYAGNASLDRIDSTKGYTKDNIQWIDKKVNLMKMNIEQSEFVNWCKLIVSHKLGLILDNS